METKSTPLERQDNIKYSWLSLSNHRYGMIDFLVLFAAPPSHFVISLGLWESFPPLVSLLLPNLFTVHLWMCVGELEK